MRIVYHSPSTAPILVWAPIVDSDTVYVGQIVACQANEGIVPMGVASGANDASNLKVPFGIVVGTNNYNEVWDSTYNTAKIVDATPLNSTTEFVMVEGPWAKGDKVAMALVELIFPSTIIEADIWNATLGTATTVGTVTTGDTNGVSCTVNALEVAGVATLASLLFRSGANAGAYRITDDSSTTAVTWDKPTTKAVAIGDTIVRANGLRVLGPSRCQFDSESLFINSAAALTSDYYGIDVLRLDLKEASKEKVWFKFNADQFCLKRA